MTTVQVRATRGENTLVDADKILDTENIKTAILDSISKATDAGQKKVDVVIEVRLDPPRSRTDYRCGRCGQMKRGHVCPVSRKRRSRRRRDGEDEEEDAVPGQIVLAPSAAGMPVVAAHPYYHPYRHFDPKMYRPGQPPMVAQTTVIAKGQLPGPAQPAPQKEGEGEASGANPAPDANMGNDGWQRAQGTWIPHGADPQGVPNAFMEHGMPPYGAAGYPGPEWDGRHHAVPMHQLSREQLAALPVEQQQQLQAAKWPASAPAAQAQPAPAAASNLGAQ